MQTSYSQFGEDRVIESFFSGNPTGFYVDVGCNDPINYSNTWKLYQKGWHGICIDANQPLIERYRNTRPRDLAKVHVISNAESEVDFYFSKASDLISGVGKKTDGPWQRTAENATIVKSQTISLTSALTLYAAPKHIQLLNIDVEGHELEVLQSINFDEYTFELIAIEIHDLDLANNDTNEVVRLLVSNGFELTSYARPTAFFKRQPLRPA